MTFRLLHAGIAVVLLGWLVAALVERRAELAKVREVADRERAETQRMKDDIARGQAMRDGLKADDPYVVEFLARDRLQYTGPGELNPPPSK
jgi:hypothetical protein